MSAELFFEEAGWTRQSLGALRVGTEIFYCFWWMFGATYFMVEFVSSLLLLTCGFFHLSYLFFIIINPPFYKVIIFI